MKKYPANRVELIEKAIISKMLSLVLIESNTYEDALKQCVLHFNELYHKDPDQVYRILVNDYVISKFFAAYISNLSGFVDFLKSTKNIESIKTLSLKEEPIMATSTIDYTGAQFQKDAFKSLKFFIAKGKTFEESITSTVNAFGKTEAFKTATKEDVTSAIAMKCFNTIQSMAKEPLKNILFLVKLLSVEQKAELKGKL